MEQQVYTDEQVTRLGTQAPYVGVLLFAYKIAGMTDPTEEQILWLAQGDAIPNGFVEYTMKTTTKGTRTGEGSGSWGTCYVCRGDFPISTMVLNSGKYYCTKEKCADDLYKES